MWRSRLLLLVALLIVCSGLFMTVGARGNWGFVIPFRGTKLATLIVVGIAISTSTVLFQTITQNRILTPSIMGFDALYILLLTAAVYFLGGQEVARMSEHAVFAFSSILLIVASLVLFGTLLWQVRADIYRMILTGIIFGVLFRSLTSFMQRMIDPNEFSIIQVASFARFNKIDMELLAISATVTAVALAFAWRMRFRLDVLALGHDAAVNLGESPRRGQFESLILIAILVSASTALVGPVAFLGLLVVSLTHVIIPTGSHAVLLLSTALVSSIVLVSGQFALERLLGLSTPLSVVVDLLGGLVFLTLLLRGLRR